MLNGKKILRTSIFGIFGYLFCLGNISNATVYTGSIPGETLQDQYAGYYYTYKIDKDLNFTTIYDDIEYPFLFYTYNGEGCSNGIRALQFFWNNGQLYTFGNFRDNTVFGQGYLKYMCKSDTSNFQEYCLANGTDSNYSTDINELYETTFGFNELYVDNLVSGVQDPSCYGGQLAVCFISDSSNVVYCIKKSIARGFTDNLTQGNLISQYGVLPSNYQNAINNNVYGVSPLDLSSGGGGDEETPIIYTGTITNKHAIYAYEQLGITPQQCYGGYPIETIYNTGTILYQGYQAGTGASILDLYNLYSGNYNGYQSTYMTEEQTKILQFLSEIYQGYENNGLSFFIGKPESIITIIQQYNNANQKATEKGRGYSLFQLYTYCDLLINKNNDEEYTGNTATPDMWWNGIDTENQEIVLPVTGSVFDELQEDGEFKRNKAQDVRDTINSVYTKLTKIFNLRGGVQGIIPDYITRILLLIILFAIFKK